MGKIVLFGFFGSGNIGNDTTFEATLHHVKNYRPDANVICVCNGPREISSRFDIQTLPMSEHEGEADDKKGLQSRINRFWSRLKDEVSFWWQRPRWFQPGDNFFIVGSGGPDDYGVLRPWHRPYVLYKWCKAAKMGGAQVIFLSTGAGPIRNRLNKIPLLKALRMADHRSYRDVAAFNYLHRIGYDTSGDLLYPDLAFSFPEASLPIPKKSSSTPKIVGLGLINYYGWQYEPGTGEKVYQEYILKMKHFSSWLLREGYMIRIIIGDMSEKGPVQDLVEFVNEEGESHWQEQLIVQEIADINDLFYQIAQTDIVIASRFHNVVCALMLERPVISIGYHEKNDFLMKEMGLEHYCQHIDHFTNERLIEQFNSCIKETDQIVPQIHGQLDNYRNLLDEQYKFLLSRSEDINLEPGIVV